MSTTNPLTAQESMDGRLMRALHGTLHLLSPKELRETEALTTKRHLSLEDQNSLLNEITAAKDMSRVHPLLD